MAANLIIGMGGTGAKIVESFIHVCGAGLGPSDTAVAFVDQDKDNGNTIRARDALSQYVKAYRRLHDQNSSVRLRETVKLLPTRLTPHGDPDLELGETALEQCLWTPHADRGATLAQMINLRRMPDPAQDLARVLFASDDEELEMTFDQGYQGRPHIGATALLYEAEDDPWWHHAKHFISEGANQDIRIFLCGSIFGGTGAALFPTVARKLRNMAREARVQNVRISGALMLPYFTFGPAEDGDNVAQSPQLMQQTKAALEYYDRVIREEDVFDNLYAIGWNPMFSLGYHEPGRRDQKNPPLVPELLAALAAAGDLRAGPSESPAGRVLSIGREQINRVDWHDLPGMASNLPAAPQDAMGSFLRTLALWKFNYRSALDANQSNLFGIGSEPWFRQLIGKSLKKDKDSTQALRDIDNYIDAALAWASLMAAYSNTSSEHPNLFRLWSASSIAKVNTDAPTSDPEFKNSFETRIEDFARLVGLYRDQARPPSAAEIYSSLNEAKAGDEAKSIGAFLGTLHSLCAMSGTEGARGS